MKSIFKLIFLLILLINFSIGEEKFGSIVGKVVDAITQQPIPGANVIIIGTDYGTVTDLDGKFLIDKIPVNIYQIRASSIGYKAEIKTDIMVMTSRPVQVDFQLNESPIELEQVVVTNEIFTRNPYELTSITNFNYEEIRRFPGGFEDVIRAVSVLPGVAQADAGRNDLIVRGGAPSENLYLIDGYVAQNINHFGTQGATGGPLSYINLDFVKESFFSTGGFSVNYGDKLSSVLSINLREGRNDRLGGKLTISATQFGLNIEGPISNKSSFFFSARRSYLDFIFKSAGFSFVPEYYDVISKVDYNINAYNSISFLFVGAFDYVRFFNKDSESRYKNSRALGSDQIQYLTGLSYKYFFNKGFLKFSLNRNFADFNTSQRDSILNPIFLNDSREGENVLKSELVYKLTKKSEFSLGTEIKSIKFNYDIRIPQFVTSFGDTLTLNKNDRSRFHKIGFYLQYGGYYFNKLRITLGTRYDYFDALTNKSVFSPRFGLSYQLLQNTFINLSSGVYYQSPSYIWLTGNEKNKNLKHIRANHIIFGFEQLLREDINLKLEYFNKFYQNYPASELRPYLVLSNTGAGFSGADDNFSSFGLEPLVSQGKGNSNGIELSIQKKSSDIPHFGLLSVTYSKTKFSALDGISRIGSYDQSWIINLSGGYIFNERWQATIKFRYSTGKPYTPFNPDGTQSIANYNTKRLPPNHSVDLRIDRRWFFEKWVLITYLDVQNIYNRKNVNFIRWDPRNKKVDDTQSIGIIPSIGISAEL